MISKIIIKNYKGIKDANVVLNKDRNILVGNNGVGKSTVIEALTLALGFGLRDLDITPYLFHTSTWKEYVNSKKLPSIEIEVFFEEDERISSFHGKNNSLKEDTVGIRLTIAFDSAYSELYKSEADKCTHIPCEYYTCTRLWFSGDLVKQLNIPISIKVIDSTSLLFHTRGSKYITKLTQDSLSNEDKVSMKSALRTLKQSFEDDELVKCVNEKLSEKSGTIKQGLSMSIDLVSQSTWNTIIHPTLEGIPVSQLGLGEQCILKTLLSIPQGTDTKPTIYIIEEPESHLSHVKLYELLSLLEGQIQGQLIVTTHSSFVANKLDLKNLILLSNSGLELRGISLKNLPKDTYQFFYKTVNYPTLRVALCDKVILVEGITDELVVTYYYNKTYDGKHPFHDGIELIVCGGLTFRYFVSLAKSLGKKIAVITDNDKKRIEQLSGQYGEQDDLYRLFTEDNPNLHTLEVAFTHVNQERIKSLGKIVAPRLSEYTLDSIKTFMLNNKSLWSYRLLEYYDNNKTECTIDVPQYIKDAIDWIKVE